MVVCVAISSYRPGRTGFWWFMGRFANYGGVYFDEEMRPLINSPNGVKALASLPSLDELRAKILGLLVAPATKIAQLTNAPAAKVARVVQAYASKGAAA